MPNAVADWSEVKATAIHLNDLKQAAELHGVSYDAIKQRASREQWPVGQRVAKQLEAAKALARQQLAKTSGTVTSVTSAAEAAEAALLELRGRGKLANATVAVKGMEHLAKQTGPDIVAQAIPAKALASVYATAFPEQQVQQAHVISVNLLGLSLAMSPDVTPSLDLPDCSVERVSQIATP